MQLTLGVATAAAIAAVSVAPGSTVDPPGGEPTFGWDGTPGHPVAAGVFAAPLARFGVQPESLTEIASTTPEASHEREVVLGARRSDGDLAIGHSAISQGRLLRVGAFLSVKELGQPRSSPAGVHPLGGWQQKREAAAGHAVVYFESESGQRADRVDWASVVGIVRSDVTRLVAELADGTRRQVALNSWRGFGYASEPGVAARKLLAYSRDGELLDLVELPAPQPLCGGAAGPCGLERVKVTR
jgi:hypothetical protein